MHKGRVEVRSKVGAGSRFIIWLKKGKDHLSDEELLKSTSEIIETQALTDTTLEYNEECRKEKGTADDKKRGLLLVEDNSELRRYLKGELNNYFRVYEARDGTEGVFKAQEKMPDVIVSDVIMPISDGFQLCEKVKGDIRLSHIPVILLTARGTVEDQIEGNRIGADAYIVKPFNTKLLRSKIEQLINTREMLFKKYSGEINVLTQTENYTSLDRDFLKVVTDYIIENISDSELTVEGVGDKMALSRSQLYRKIKALSGYSVNEFIRVIRLEQAKKLILLRQQNINEICFSIGFSSPSYFSKCYKEYFGKLPSEE